MAENGDCTGLRPRPRGRGLSPLSASCLPDFLFRAVEFSGSRLRIIDQTRLPHRVTYLYPTSAVEVAATIKRLSVRGAPAIGVAAAYGLAVEARRLPDASLSRRLAAAAKTLIESRPTAVNLEWAVVRVMRSVSGAGRDCDRGLPRLSAKENRGCTRPRPLSSSLRQAVLNEAKQIEHDEIERSLAMARHGAKLLPKNVEVLTICNTGALAAPGMGTALGVVFQVHLDGKRPHVYACETRPLLQGSRLTTLELQRAKIPVTLIADSAAASVIDRCDVVLVGADRIAANGDTANKVGTRMLATLARAAHKPFYVVAPSSTFDLATSTGQQIVVEERDGEEVRAFAGCRAAPARTAVFNPAFDVTPARLITGFITDRGILLPPFRKSISQELRRA
jgi:methylthioribose-1-phosphate isomerase